MGPDEVRERGRAFSNLRWAIRQGKMPKPTELRCADCDGPTSVYHHHLGYAREHQLSVLPLCRSCWCIRTKRGPVLTVEEREKRQAHNNLLAAVVRGLIPKASTLTCVDCGGPADRYHHHLGYSVEHQFSVVPLCHDCHITRHWPSRIVKMTSQIAKTPKATKRGRALAALRPRVVCVCAHCEHRFSAYPYAQYCSGRCRVAAFRKRAGAEDGGDVASGG